MNSESAGIVVVGASLAGLRGAEALRRGGYDGPLTLVGAEPHRPYDRPPLSKHVLAGELEAGATRLPVLSTSHTPLCARWRLGSPAVALDRANRTIQLADGSVLGYEKLLVATGAEARGWPTETGGSLAGIHTLRGRDDAAALRADLTAGSRRVLIVGGGLIGCETASCLRDLGIPVTVVDPNPTPLARSLGSLVGGVIADCMHDAGAEFRPGTQVRAFEGDDAGRVVRARLADGSTIEADLVIAALGATRATGWLRGAGLMADPAGLTCDEACRARDIDGMPCPDIYAAGDVARWPIRLYGGRLISVEHWGNAVEQAAHAARNMLASSEDQQPYDHLPAFWSSQFGINIKGIGLTEGADAIAVVQGSRKSRRFLAVYGQAGRSVAAVSFDEARWLPAYAATIAAGGTFPPIADANDQPQIEKVAPGFPQPRSLPRQAL
ncbi:MULTISPECIES: FAD-dependent oxidoreductase [unclassified Methylobacterium]|jgi:NADPH-dependent 2,4-dienoyl-CoA reductase/sulfur reductase-like enzyme|uniref:NAD(P)/FAD-dependent oxidoreductase n=1 Tax=unclassified Methylobacterium TaxID=2615210 RepID=UPI0005BAF7D6|nr:MULTISPECIES: FAD-dependent oxidoreductase [unclassified Methylobacterium]SFU96949.1 Reductase C-terminal [Methylobacterium sp. UNCCL125]